MRTKLTILDVIKDRILLLDGAMGSELIKAGLPAGTPSENWNISEPEIIKKIHTDYYQAGSDAVLTNTFGGTRIKLEALRHGNKIEEYNKAAVELARSVCPEDCFIAGDIGPTGKFLPPVGDATPELLEENFYEQIQILAECDVDFFFIETMMDIEEALIAVTAAKKATNLPIITSMTFQKTKRGFFTIMGNSIEQSISALHQADVDAIGVNCTIDSKEMIELISFLREKTLLPLSAKPNAGKPELQQGVVTYPTSIDDFSNDIFKIIAEGARIVGGCCGTNPEYIRAISKKIQGNDFEAH